MRQRLLASFLGFLIVAALGCDADRDSGPGDGTGGTGGQSVNLRPVAVAGGDASAAVLSQVRLNGSASLDPEGSPLSFSWTLVRVPAESLSRLEGSETVNPSFVPDRVGDYVVSLVVFDGTSSSLPDMVTIQAASDVDLPPIAVAGQDVQTLTGQAAFLNGRQSWDPEGQPLTYRWKLVARPDGSGADVFGSASPGPYIVPDVSGTYRIQLVVRDGANESEPDDVLVVAEQGGGEVDAGPDQQVAIGETVTLHGSNTLSCDSDQIRWDWYLASRPPASRLSFHAPGESLQFLPDTVGTFVVGLDVMCTTLRETDEAVVEVVPPSGGGEVSVLGYRAIDAEVSRSLDKVVLVSEGPATLHLLDPADGTEAAVALPQNPSAVSVSPDGREAAVGHDGWVSVVDLEAMQVTATWPAGVNVGDVVHGGNGWVYAFPTGTAYEPVRGIEIATGRQVQSPANTMAGYWAQRLSASTLLSVWSGDLFRIDLAADGTPSIGWRRFDDDQSPGDKFWIAADGARIFGDTGAALWLGDGTADGVSYAGSLAGNRPVHLAQAGGIGRIALVGTGASPWERTSDVVLLEDVYLAEQQVHTLPWIEYDGAWKPIFGRFVFFDAAEGQLLVVADMNPLTYPEDTTDPDILVRIAL